MAELEYSKTIVLPEDDPSVYKGFSKPAKDRFKASIADDNARVNVPFPNTIADRIARFFTDLKDDTRFTEEQINAGTQAYLDSYRKSKGLPTKSIYASTKPEFPYLTREEYNAIEKKRQAEQEDRNRRAVGLSPKSGEAKKSSIDEKHTSIASMKKSAYWEGFQESCSRFGVDADVLLKIAGFRVPRKVSLKGFQSIRPNSSSFRTLREKAPVHGSKRIIPTGGKLTSLVGSGLLAGRVGGSLIRPHEQEASSVPTVNDSRSGIHFDPGIIPSAPLNEAKVDLPVGNFNEPTIAERKQDFMNRLRNIKSIKDVSRYEGQNLSEGNTGLALTGNAVPNE